MSDCCASDAGCSVALADEEAASPVCESCGQNGKPVQSLTPESLLKPDAAAQLKETTYRFCATPTCDVVYFSNGTEQYFHEADVKVRVGLKQTEHPIPVCYCFDYTVRDVQEEIKTTGTTTIPDRIRAEITAGTCRCERKNPQGSCCLGNVNRAVKQAIAEDKSCLTE